jgi:hypothetical protein
MNRTSIEIWADSFHEGEWCCSQIASIAKENCCSVVKNYVRGLQPHYTITGCSFEIELLVFGSYKSWSPMPPKIKQLIKWGKPDFIAYDPTDKEIIFAVEETAATPTGNQAMQRCERQYGSARLSIPYWYLISEFGVHKDGGVRRDSIWPTIAALKLSILKQSPCMVLHYSDIDNPEDYSSGKGVNLLFSSLFSMLKNHSQKKNDLYGLSPLLKKQYLEMLSFLNSQWKHIIDFLPSEEMVKDPKTAEILAEIATGNSTNRSQIDGFLEWPIIKNVPSHVRDHWISKDLIKFDPLCQLFENDIALGNAYYLSDNAGSGKPPTTAQIKGYINQQKALFAKAKNLNPPATFTMSIDDFPLTGKDPDRRHVTTAKNIVYLYDSWNTLRDTIVEAYPRLSGHLQKRSDDLPVFVYVSNSMKPGRLFGDPFTGQLSAFSTAFGKFDKSRRMVVAYFPHQVHTQAITSKGAAVNKGMTLMTELTDYIIFNAGVTVNLSTQEVM